MAGLIEIRRAIGPGWEISARIARRVWGRKRRRCLSLWDASPARRCAVILSEDVFFRHSGRESVVHLLKTMCSPKKAVVRHAEFVATPVERFEVPPASMCASFHRADVEICGPFGGPGTSCNFHGGFTSSSNAFDVVLLAEM